MYFEMKKKSNISRQSSSRFEKNVKRVFALVPLIYNNQGIEFKNLMDLAGYNNQKDLQIDLDRLLLFGIPPYSPSDFITLHVEDDRVYLDFPQGLEQPLDLNSAEWMALQKVIQSEREFQSVDSMNTEIINDLLQKISSIPLLLSSADQNREKRSLLKEALEDSIQIQFLYSSLASKEPELRRIDPWVFFEHKKSGYVMGFCHTRREARSFLLDRMSDFTLLDENIEKDCPVNIEQIISKTAIFDTSPKGFTVKLAFEKTLKRHLELILDIKDIQQINEDAINSDQTKGWLVGTTKINSSQWFLEVVKGLGSGACIIEPDFLREKMCQFLDEMEIPILLSDDI